MKIRRVVRRMVGLSVLWMCSLTRGDEIPEWWIARGVVNTQLPPSDYSVVNLGQLKHVAYQTWVEMTHQLAQIATNANETDPFWTVEKADYATVVEIQTVKGRMSNVESQTSSWNSAVSDLGFLISELPTHYVQQQTGGTVNVSSNLTVQGKIIGNASELTEVAAGGAEGSIQFNEDGILSGNTNFFIHAETEKLAFNASEGNVFRAYKDSVLNENLIYVVRRFENTTEICLLEDGEETLRLRGDGSIYATGALQVGGLSFNDTEIDWFIPEEGDLSMGTFTQE